MRRRRRPSISLPARTFAEHEYYQLKRLKSKGQSVTVTLLCNQGNKMHKITFYDRGPVHLHDHNLKCERAMQKLDESIALPRCVQVLNAWSDGRFEQYYDLARRAYLPVQFRGYVRSLHAHAKMVADADGFDLKPEERHLAVLAAFHDHVAGKIKDRYVRGWRERRYYYDPRPRTDYVQYAKIDPSKIRLGIAQKPKLVEPVKPQTQGIGASDARLGALRASEMLRAKLGVRV